MIYFAAGVVASVAAVGAVVAMARGLESLRFGMNVIAAVGYGARGVMEFWVADYGMALWSASLAGLFAYLAWISRPRRKRLADKVTGVVRDLGHRLKVVAVPAPAGES